MRPHTGHVGILGNLPSYTYCVYDAYQVVVITAVPVKGYIDTVVDETYIGSYVQLMLFFISQSVIFQLFNLQSGLLNICGGSPRVIAVDNCQRVTDISRPPVCRQ